MILRVDPVGRPSRQALAEIRTDLNVFTPAESLALMACSYQMASKAFHRALRHLHELFDDGVAGTWPFADMLKDITYTGRHDRLER